jgi:hypothetical protein
MLSHSNMAAKCALEARNPGIILHAQGGEIRYGGFDRKNGQNGQNGQYGQNGQNGGGDEHGGGNNGGVVGASRGVLYQQIDLHGLFTHEAVAVVSSAVDFYRNRQQSSGGGGAYSTHKTVLLLIVGKGNHSVGKVAKLGPKLRAFFEKYGHSYTYAPQDGVMRLRIND